MRETRWRIRMLIAVGLVITLDLVALRSFPLSGLPNPGLLLSALLLQAGLFGVAFRTGTSRRFWIGFEIFGWLYVLPCILLNGPIFRSTLSAYRSAILGGRVPRTGDMIFFSIASVVAQLIISLAIAYVGGLLSCRFLAKSSGLERVEEGPPVDPKSAFDA